MRKILIFAVALPLFIACAGTPPALADCRSENTACIKGASSPLDSVACGSLFRTCAAHHAQAQAKQNAMNRRCKIRRAISAAIQGAGNPPATPSAALLNAVSILHRPRADFHFFVFVQPVVVAAQVFLRTAA